MLRFQLLKFNETRDSLKDSLLDIEVLFLNNSIDTYKKGVKRIMEKEIISKFVESEYAVLNGDRISLTEKGFYVSNTILTDLL